jgi:hypothetical protein
LSHDTEDTKCGKPPRRPLLPFQATVRLCLYQAIKALDPAGTRFLLLITARRLKDRQSLGFFLACSEPSGHNRIIQSLLRHFADEKPATFPWRTTWVEALMRLSGKRLTLV